MTALSAVGLTVRYPGQARAALLNVDIALQPGERLLLLGPNGAGKSTFIRVFAGLMQPTRGRAQIYEQPARSATARATVGVVGHATYLYDELNAAENLRLYAELYGVDDGEARSATVLERVGLSHLAGVRVGNLSRGQQQRVAIARALLHDPSVLLLDEPDAGLDHAAFELLANLVIQGERTVLLTTHNLANGMRLATRAAVLSNGQVVHALPSLGPPDAPLLLEWLDRAARG